jgi:hypothetical protein
MPSSRFEAEPQEACPPLDLAGPRGQERPCCAVSLALKPRAQEQRITCWRVVSTHTVLFLEAQAFFASSTGFAPCPHPLLRISVLCQEEIPGLCFFMMQLPAGEGPKIPGEGGWFGYLLYVFGNVGND